MSRSAPKGELAIVLHTHMPYVEGFGTWPFGEEWLWEAMIGSYLPLLDLLDAGAPLTLSLTPVLCDQLEAPAIAERFVRFVDEVRRYTHHEDARGLRAGGHEALACELERSWLEHERALERFRERGEDLLGAFAPYAQWTSSATHAVLPLLATDAGVRAQVQTGVDSHRARFGPELTRPPGSDGGHSRTDKRRGGSGGARSGGARLGRDWRGGFWLPECAHAPHLDPLLADAGVRSTCVELTNRFGLGSRQHLRPLATEAGVVLVPIDRATIDLVWGERGYPAAGVYRDYHRHTVHHHQPWANDGSAYDHGQAIALARGHARDFVRKTIERLRGGGLVVCALDTELLGHWWYEGVHWLEAVVEECSRHGLALVRLDEAAAMREPAAVDDSSWEPSTWGSGGDLSTWSGPAVADMAFDMRAGELRALAALEQRRGADTQWAPAAPEQRRDADAHRANGSACGPQTREPRERAMLRELLAVQASDWPFMISRGLAVPYARERFEGHRAALEAALRGEEAVTAARNLAPGAAPAVLLGP